MAESLEPVLMLYQPLPLLYLVSSIAPPVNKMSCISKYLQGLETVTTSYRNWRNFYILATIFIFPEYSTIKINEIH